MSIPLSGSFETAELPRIAGEPVTITVARHIRPGYEAAFLRWQSEVVSTVLEAPGCLGATVLHPGRDGGAVAWPKVKAAACKAIQSLGGTLSHHHATGRDHTPYLPGEIGELGIEALAGIKERLDPAGIMNPGKLIPAD